jgi:hypothetical protein
MHWEQPAQTLSPPSRGGMKIPTDPPRGGMLDLRHGLDEPLDPGTPKVPQAKAIGDDWHHTQPVQQTLLIGLQAPDRIAKHAHGTHLSECPGCIEPPPPSPGTEARDIFPAQPPHIVVWEVRAVKHMLLTAGHWLATVDVSSVLLHEQQGLFELAAAAFVVAGQRFPSAHVHEPSCPLSHEADTMPPPSLMGVPVSHIGSPTGHVSSTPSVCPRCKGRPAKR